MCVGSTPHLRILPFQKRWIGNWPNSPRTAILVAFVLKRCRETCIGGEFSLVRILLRPNTTLLA